MEETWVESSHPGQDSANLILRPFFLLQQCPASFTIQEQLPVPAAGGVAAAWLLPLGMEGGEWNGALPPLHHSPTSRDCHLIA